MREIVDDLRENGPNAGEVERARAYAAGRRVLAFENTNAVARFAATQAIVFGEDIDPDRAIDALDAVTFDDVTTIAKAVDPEGAAVACVGPHDEAEF
jgi:predicted Zn-dependent peptidase